VLSSVQSFVQQRCLSFHSYWPLPAAEKRPSEAGICLVSTARGRGVVDRVGQVAKVVFVRSSDLEAFDGVAGEDTSV
jgi:hypothetical protein